MCENCNRIVEVEYLDIKSFTMFGDIGFQGSVCESCKSSIEFCIYQYMELFDVLTTKINKRKQQLDFNTRNGLK